MGTISLDFDNVPDFEPIPSGDYPVVVDHVEVRTGKDSGQPYLNWELVVSEGEFEGRHLFMTSGLSEKSLWRLKTIFANLGILESQMEIEVDDESSYVISPELAGVAAIAVVTLGVYQNKPNNSVGDLLPIDAPALPASTPAPVPAPRSTPIAKPVGRTSTPPSAPTTRAKLNLK